MKKEIKRRGRHRALTEDEYREELKKKSYGITISFFPVYREEQDLLDWLSYISEHTPDTKTSYIKRLIAEDRAKRLDDAEKWRAEKEALLKELS